MKQILSYVFFMFVAFAFAQTQPIDFETGGNGASWSWNVSENDSNPALEFVANPDATGNLSSTVAKFTALPSPSNPWALTETQHGSPLGTFDLSATNAIIKIWVYKPVISRVGIKLVTSTDGAQPEKFVSNTVINQWEELTFDFSSNIGLGDTTGLDQIVIFPDRDANDTPRAQTNICYFDNITFSSSGGSSLTQMDLPVTFEDSTVNYGLVGFGGAENSNVVPNPDMTGANTSGTVAQVVKSNTAMTWAGTTVTAIENIGGDDIQTGFANAIPFDATTTKMNVAVWSPDAGITVRLKVEDHTNAGVSVETDATTTVANAWEILEFDFSNHAANTAALDLTKTYDKASIFFNFGVDGATAGEKTYYFDNVDFGEASTLIQMDLPVTFEDNATVNYGLVGFGGAEASTIESNPDMSGANTSATVAKVIKSNTAQTWAGTTVTAIENIGGDDVQTGFASAIPFTSSATKMNVAVWSPDSGITVKLKVEDHTTPANSVETDVTTTVANAWEILEFDFSNNSANTPALDLTKTYNKASIFFNFGVDGATAGEKTYYFDNVNFGSLGVDDLQNNTNTIALYPNPARDIVTIKSEESVKNVQVYNSAGQVVLSSTQNQFDVSALPSGIYMVQIQTENNVKVEKLIKQ